ncbi:hypothetical protein [Halalkalicoccus sp. NIPERK01]|uniref:hypothetical protein n=1 Tax=Halalkalicoccus sp. NIPERK01 TaxID=3053469 RepID=UPI00256F3EEB|nr:hypothetical protein [Halalkalicoccus sp. NIPERK01]MDL5361384.1 hypothetical protein [Halalkalicoccus sp. NIPERK01]
MDRRTALKTAGSALTFTVAGCLGDGDGPGDGSGSTGSEGNDPETDNTEGNGSEYSIEDRTYEECHLISIEYEWLPEDVRNEVDIALDDGRYEADELLFAEAVDPGRSYLVVDDTPYDPTVETDGETWTLELHEDEVVRAPEPRLIIVQNSAGRDHEVHVELTGDDTFVDETVTITAGEEREIAATDEFGRYELTAQALTGHEGMDSFEFVVSDSAFDGIVEVTDTEVWVSQDVADVVPCSWDTTKSGASGG